MARHYSKNENRKELDKKVLYGNSIQVHVRLYTQWLDTTVRMITGKDWARMCSMAVLYR